VSNQIKSVYQGIAYLLQGVTEVRSQTDLGYVTALVATTAFWIAPYERPDIIYGLTHVMELVNQSGLDGKHNLAKLIPERINWINALPHDPPAHVNGHGRVQHQQHEGHRDRAFVHG
jgi:hypothetical protein